MPTAAALTTDRTFATWREYVEQRSGLSLDGPLAGTLARYLGERVRVGRFRDTADLLRHVRTHPAGTVEWEALSVRLLNGDTRFFRDAPTFDALTNHVLPTRIARLPEGGDRCIRMWSAGCSTGQEAYSMAMVGLATAGPGWDVRVTGTDANPESLARAADGWYRTHEIGIIPDHLRRYVTATDSGGALVTARVRAVVTFERLQLATDVPYPVPPQDVIVCQNVFLYYTAAVRAEMLRQLAAALAPGGYLFLGPADPVCEPPPGLRPVRLTDTRAYQRCE